MTKNQMSFLAHSVDCLVHVTFSRIGCHAKASVEVLTLGRSCGNYCSLIMTVDLMDDKNT